MKILVLVLVGAVVAATGAYYYMEISDSKYYDDYKLQCEAINSSAESSANAMQGIFASMLDLSKNNTNITQSLSTGRNKAKEALGYQQEMLRHAKTDIQKQYAETLIKQTETVLNLMDVMEEFNTVMEKHDQGQMDNLMKKMEEIAQKVEQYQKELDDIKNKDPNFKEKLEQKTKKE
jgi:uncharacterized membrane protein YgaE (UPF0421/DUF939 family)